MIIWGTRTTILVMAMLNFVCGGCQNPAAHSVKRRLTKFTLFFIPLFPVASSYFTQCTFCGASTRVTKDQATQMKTQAGGEQPPHQQQAGYGYPQQQAGQAPFQAGGYGYPQQQAAGQNPYAQNNQAAQQAHQQGGYGYPQQAPGQNPYGQNPYGDR